MGTKKSKYDSAEDKNSLLGNITADLETKGDVKNSSIETVKDLIIGVLGGGVVGAAIGRASLAVGAVVTGIGHYTKSRLASVFGIGMMASGGFSKPAAPVNGLGEQDVMDGVKERVTAFKDGFSEKLFLDKFFKSKKPAIPAKKDDNTAGVGEVQYFSYPDNKELQGDPVKELDMAALDHLEQQIASSGQNFIKKQDMKGLADTENEVGNTTDPDMGDIEPGERNF